MVRTRVPSNFQVVQVSRVRLNPYVRLLQMALSEAGVSCSTVEELGPLRVPWQPGVANILHLHWLELLYSARTTGRTLLRLAGVLAGLAQMKARGGKLVYTVHNLRLHEGGRVRSVVNRVANAALYRLVDAVHVHDEEAKMGVVQVYGRFLGSRYGHGASAEVPLQATADRIYVVPHGSYIGAYPNDCTRQEARARLGLAEEAVVYLCLGQIRRYKGIEDLIAAFKKLSVIACDETATDRLASPRDCQLVLAGHAHDAVYAESLLQLTHGQEGIFTHFRYVDDAELQYFMNACDVCVLPYRDITTSGAAILAFSFGKPVIAPALGGFPELVAGGRGIVYDPQSSDGLLCALQEARARRGLRREAPGAGADAESLESAGQKALAWAKEHDWRALAPRFIAIYESVLETGSSPQKTGVRST